MKSGIGFKVEGRVSFGTKLACTARARLSPSLNIKFISLRGNRRFIKYEKYSHAKYNCISFRVFNAQLDRMRAVCWLECEVAG